MGDRFSLLMFKVLKTKRKATAAPDGNHPPIKKKTKLCSSTSTSPPSSFNVVDPFGTDLYQKSTSRDTRKANYELPGNWTEGRVEPRWIDSLMGVDVIVPGCWVASSAGSQKGFIANFKDGLFEIYLPLLDTNCTVSYNDLKTVIDYSQFYVEPHHLPAQTPMVLKLG